MSEKKRTITNGADEPVHVRFFSPSTEEPVSSPGFTLDPGESATLSDALPPAYEFTDDGRLRLISSYEAHLFNRSER